MQPGTDVAVNVLLSYAFHAKTDLGAVRRNLVCGRLMIDSGAFSAHNSGTVIDRAEYAQFLRRWWGCWDHAITLDAIGDPATTRVNTRWLHEQGLPVMPVFTPGDTLPDFDAMVRDHGYVCVGGLVGLPPRTQRARVRMLQQRAQRAGGGIHALGIGSLALLRASRPFSADASSVESAFRFGSIVYYDGRTVRCTPITNRDRLSRDIQRIRAHGIDLASIATRQRMPTYTDGGSGPLLRGMSTSYAVADDVLKSELPVPDPHNDRAGTHLYSSVMKSIAARYASSLDTLLHSEEEPPLIWAQHAHLHTCHANERITADAAAS